MRAPLAVSALLVAGLFAASQVSAAQNGRLWRSAYSLKAQATLSETVGADGSVRTVGRGEAVPWPDGTRFATLKWDTDNTAVRIVDTATGTQRHGVEFKGLLQDAKPSPVRPEVMAARQGKSTLGPFVWVITDFAQRSFLDRFPASSAAFAWLPDGDYITVSSAGEIRRASVGQGAQARVVGRLALPSGRSVANAWVNPQGTAMVLRLDLRPPTGARESDLWVANLDGGGFARYTATRMSSVAAWSPDGRRIAFDVNTGTWCTGSSCQGTCEVWHADANAREVRATAKAGDADPFTLRDAQGRRQRMGCALRGWTR